VIGPLRLRGSLASKDLRIVVTSSEHRWAKLLEEGRTLTKRSRKIDDVDHIKKRGSISERGGRTSAVTGEPVKARI